MQVQAYLYFDGRAAEAIAFYKTALGATVNMQMLFKEGDKHTIPPGAEDKIMHADISIGESRVLISDGYSKGNPKFDGFALTITTKTVAEADKIFAALAEGGKVTMPQTKTFFSPRFGMLTDGFGVNWIVLAAQ
jgi:PhnB protein